MGSRAKYKRKQAERTAAQKKVPEKFAQAAKQPEPALANRLIRRARRLAMKFRMSLGPYKHHYCNHCYARLNTSNSRVRVHGGKVIIFCSECKNFRRIPVTPKRKEKMRAIQEEKEEKIAKKKEQKARGPKRIKRGHVKKAAVSAAKKAVEKRTS